MPETTTGIAKIHGKSKIRNERNDESPNTD